jgi:acyl-CoA reductase-like NAD-dependent aldehyde dehydrogenase
MDLANNVQYGLSASVFTRDLNRVLQFARMIDVGMVRVNGETAGVEPQAPFGGMKASSSHSREQGRAALEFFTSVKTVAISPAGA